MPNWTRHSARGYLIAGELESFARLYDEHVFTVYGFIGYRVGSREEAEDLTQLTFERAMKAWSRFDPQRASERTWLLAIARNIVIDSHRKRKAAVTEIEQAVADEHGALSTPGPEEGRGLGVTLELASALERLSERDREVIALRFGGEMTGPEIAELTGLSLANVQQIISRSLRKLRLALEGGEVPTGPGSRRKEGSGS